MQKRGYKLDTPPPEVMTNDRPPYDDYILHPFNYGNTWTDELFVLSSFELLMVQ